MSWDNINNFQAPEKAAAITSVRFIKENFGENHSVKTKEHFQKIWTFQNTGDAPIPAGSLMLVQDSGHEFF